MLRMAAERLLDLDQSYSDRIKAMYGMKNGKPTAEGLSALTQTLGSGYLGGTSANEIRNDLLLGPTAQAILEVTNVSSRYVAPLAGVALAAKGIYDVTGGGTPMEQTPSAVMP